jgi:hypothetical protein
MYVGKVPQLLANKLITETCGFTQPNLSRGRHSSEDAPPKQARPVCGGFYSLSFLNPFSESGERSVGSQSLHVDTVTLNLALLLELDEIRVNVLGETVFTRDENLLTAGELELGSTEGLLSMGNVLDLGSDGDKDGANSDTGCFTEGLAVSVTHTGLKSISTGAGEHLVDADHMPGVNSDSDMETFLTSVVLHVLVSGNTGGLESLRCDLLLLVGNHMDAGWEHVPVGLLLSTVVHTDLGVGHTTVEARLRVGLVLLISIATSWSSSHFDLSNINN